MRTVKLFTVFFYNVVSCFRFTMLLLRSLKGVGVIKRYGAFCSVVGGGEVRNKNTMLYVIWMYCHKPAIFLYSFGMYTF